MAMVLDDRLRTYFEYSGPYMIWLSCEHNNIYIKITHSEAIGVKTTHSDGEK